MNEVSYDEVLDDDGFDPGPDRFLNRRCFYSCGQHYYHEKINFLWGAFYYVLPSDFQTILTSHPCPYCKEREQSRQERLQQLKEQIEEIDKRLDQEIEKLTDEEIQRKKDRLAEVERKKAEEEERKKKEAKKAEEAEEEDDSDYYYYLQKQKEEEERRCRECAKDDANMQEHKGQIDNFNESLLQKLANLIDEADHKITTMCSLNLGKTTLSTKKAKEQLNTLRDKLDQLGTDLNRQRQEHFSKLDENHQRGNYEQNSVVTSSYYTEQCNRGKEFEQQFMNESNAIVNGSSAIVAKLLDKKFANVRNFVYLK